MDQFEDHFTPGIQKILDVFEIEQNHDNSPYTFRRPDNPKDDKSRETGIGMEVEKTGMIWSGFRPSDDACQYGYLVPSNMFAVVILGYIEKIFSEILNDPVIVKRAQKLKREIQAGIENYAVVKNKAGKEVYAYEVDGKGNALLMDDSNVPSLMSAPYLDYLKSADKKYQQTRETLLSSENPYYYEGKFAKGIGSPHTPENYVWPIALSIQALTSESKKEKARILDMLVSIDAGTHLMHEGIDVDNPQNFTREWFSWANMMFCELVMDYFDIRVLK